jgi:Leucine-rich repeat (LRR) protein
VNGYQDPDLCQNLIDPEHFTLILVPGTAYLQIISGRRHISGLDKLPNLKRLYLVSNKISKIENLEQLTQLEMLELGDNKIRKIENLDKLTSLTQLFLGKNKIRKRPTLNEISITSCQTSPLQ